jgi:hypothetical protein
VPIFDVPPRAPGEEELPLPIVASHGACLLGIHAAASAILAIVLEDGLRSGGSLAFEVVIDVVLGALLVARWERAVALAIVRLGAGAVILSGVALTIGAPGLVAIELVGVLAMALVLFGSPTVLRARAGLALASVHALALVIALTTGYGLGISDGSTTELRGAHLPYRLALPPTGWVAPHEEVRRLEMPDVDSWAVREDVGAEVMVVARLGVDPTGVTVDELERDAIASLGDPSEVAVIDRDERPSGRRVVHAVVRVPAAGDADVIVGVQVVPGVAYRVVAVVDSQRFPQMESELRGIVESFEPGS